MPSNHYLYVCVPCRSVSKDFSKCQTCGEPCVLKSRWSPPKKTNGRAWKRIEKGEWLWDRRRVRRHNENLVTKDKIPGRKKGTPMWLTRYIRTKNGPNADLGG